MGHDFDRIHDKVSGGRHNRINKQKHLYGSDYIYLYQSDNDDSDFDIDKEVGINKNYHRFHDMDWINDLKNEKFYGKRDIIFDGEEYVDVRDLINDMTDVEDFLFGGSDE